MHRWIPWVVLYVVLLTALIVGIFQARTQLLVALDTPAAIEDWQKWKAATEKAATGQEPVKRKAVRANEPALLIMLRDRMVIVVTGATILTSLLYFFVVIVIRGIFGQPPPASSKDEGSD